MYFKDKMLLMQAQENGVTLDEDQLLFIAGGQDNVVDNDVDEQPVQDLALNVDNVFQADDCDAFESDVDEAPTTQTIFMANLSSADPVYDEASPSYDSDILSEVPDHDNYQDAVCEHHEVHEMHGDVQPNYVVDSHADYTSDSNMILYDQYVKDNAMPVVQSNVSSVPNDAYMMILNDMHEQSTHNNAVDKSLTAELATYKEQVKLYERRAKFELTEREQNIEEQLRIVITKEENLKKELHSIKMQLSSTINHNKSMVEEVTYLKKDFKQKENKYLEEFLDMKALKEKVEDKLYKQDQSLQTVHMLCKPKPYYDEQKKDLIKMKAEALKEQTTASIPIKALTVFSNIYDAFTAVQKRIAELESENSYLKNKIQNDDHDGLRFSDDSINRKSHCSSRKNELFRVENEKVKQHYKDVYDSIKITRAKHIEQITALLTENENLKAQLHENMKCVTMDSVKPRVLAPGRYAIDFEPTPPLNRNNREVHLDYLKHLKESVETLREIVEEAKHASTPLTRKKQVTFEDQCETSNKNTHKHVERLNIQKTNVLVIPSIGVNSCTDASRSKPRRNAKKNRISPAKSVHKKKVEEHPRTNKSNLKTRIVLILVLALSVLLSMDAYGKNIHFREQCPLTRLTKSKVVPAKQTENVSTSKTMLTGKLSHTSQKPLIRYQRRNQQYQAIPVSIPTPPENQAISTSMKADIAYANQLDPN
ncbi:hypothetical protein Tco_1327335 [Tanacetum coccineum]